MKKADRKPILGLTMGDPAGIGPEVIAKAVAMPAVRRLCRPIVIGSLPVMEWTVRSLRLPLRVVAVSPSTTPFDKLMALSQSKGRVERPFDELRTPSRVEGLRASGRGPSTGPRTGPSTMLRAGPSTGLRAGELPVLDPLAHPLGRFTMGKVGKQTGAASAAFIVKAVRLAELGCLDAIVTGPINKEAINLAGYDYPGHTEMLADLTKSKAVGMMILGGPLKIMFVTTHVAVKDLSAALTPERIGKAIRLAHRALREFWGVAKPRIGVAAFNPHAGEHGLFGNEERRTILPACRKARAAGIAASDPLPADTLFGKAARGAYDGVVAMYHDQGLIPLKLLAFGRCVNLTVGLPIIRTSVDHGTAYDIAGKGIADPGSMVEAITLAARLATQRK